jgi:hypothetical protein
MDDIKERFICGNKVQYEQSDKDGIYYLENDIECAEADVFFYYARHRKPAPFEDDRERQFELSYEGSDTYKLSRR